MKSSNVAPLAVTRPTGLNLSPRLKECPSLAISNDSIENKVDPIPTVELAPTLRVTRRFDPVVVPGTPFLDTPTTSMFEYVGSGNSNLGFT